MKKTWILIGIIMLLFSFYQIATTYAKYIAQATATTEKQAGAWIIEVNDDNITDGTNTFTINSLTYPGNAFVKEGKIAPSSSGYFEIIIDPTGTSVAVRYDVTLNTAELADFDAIGLSAAYKVVGGTETSTGLVRTGTNTYSGTISLADVANGNSERLRFYILWEERGTAAGDISDSAIGLTEQETVGLPITVEVSQYKGEILVPIE